MSPGEQTAVRVWRCVVADDHPGIVNVVCRYLDNDPEIEVVARAGAGPEALQAITELEPDIAVLDVQMPAPDGIEIARGLTERAAPTGAILYTGNSERALLLRALDAGARGFVLKESPLVDLARAIKHVGGGGVYVDAALAGVLIGSEATAQLSVLTDRERQVLSLLAEGQRTGDIATELSISALTVKTHLRKAMEKLDADTRTQAVASALRRSLI